MSGTRIVFDNQEGIHHCKHDLNGCKLSSHAPTPIPPQYEPLLTSSSSALRPPSHTLPLAPQHVHELATAPAPPTNIPAHPLDLAPPQALRTPPSHAPAGLHLTGVASTHPALQARAPAAPRRADDGGARASRPPRARRAPAGRSIPQQHGARAAALNLRRGLRRSRADAAGGAGA